MKLSSVYSVILISFSLMTMGWQCEKYIGDEVKIDHQFSEKLTLTPYKKVYSINDTIWLEFQTANKSLFDKVTNSNVDTDTSFINMIFYYHRRYPVNGIEEFFSAAQVENGIDVSFKTLYAWYNVLEFKTGCSDNRYFFKVSFVPKKTGIYSIEKGIGFSYCANKVIRPHAGFTEFPFDLADCNKDIYLSIPPASRGTSVPGQLEREIDNKRIFFFKVE
jgi:hypothetical protein